jgi:hypothetical protein
MIMAEAGEVGHWWILRELNGRARNAQIAALVELALPTSLPCSPGEGAREVLLLTV